MSSSASHKRPWLEAAVWSGLTLIALAVLLWVNATAREVAAQAALALLQFFTTPFILEISVAVVGLCIVLAINQFRLRKDNDEWVYLQKTEVPPPASENMQAPAHRLDAVVWTDKPMPFDERGAELSVIEGFLALGMPAEAARAFEESLVGEAANEPRLAQGALLIAEWHWRNDRHAVQADAWLRRALKLDAECLATLPVDHPLRQATPND